MVDTPVSLPCPLARFPRALACSPRPPPAALPPPHGPVCAPAFGGRPTCFRAGCRRPVLASPALSHARVHSRPSVYWTDRFLEDTTLTVTVPGRWSPPRLLLWQGPLGSGLGWRWPLPQLWCLATLSDMLPLTSWGRVTPRLTLDLRPPWPWPPGDLPCSSISQGVCPHPDPVLQRPLSGPCPLRSQSQLEAGPGATRVASPPEGSLACTAAKSGPASTGRRAPRLPPTWLLPFLRAGSLRF